MPDEQPIARSQQLDRHVFEAAGAKTHRRPADASKKGSHFPPRPAFGEALQQLTAGIHEGHDIASQRLSERQGRGHRQRRHDVEPELAPAQGGDDFVEQRQQDRQRACCPNRLGDTGGSAKGEIAPGSESRQGHDNQADPVMGPQEIEGMVENGDGLRMMERNWLPLQCRATERQSHRRRQYLVYLAVAALMPIKASVGNCVRVAK